MKWRLRKGRAFLLLSGAATLFAVAALWVLLGDVLLDGAGRLRWGFLTGYASRFPEQAGIRAALAGSAWVLGLTALLSLPISLGAAIWLEEFAPDTWWARAFRVNIANLAGVPSIVYGILGLALFVRALGLGQSVLSGALTLSLLVMPIAVLATQEALRAVPSGIREAGYALGATRWQIVYTQVLPRALPGILTGTILALSRAVGETAPLIVVGAVGFVAFSPQGPMDPYTVLPVQVFSWITRPQPEFRELAAAGIIVLLTLLLAVNSAAILVRNRYRSRM
jgi:phosphate transport system permease protein